MFGRLFPRSIDNVFPGYWLGAWILGIVVAGKLAMGVNGTFNTVSIATSADSIPLSTYPADAAETAVALFALLSLTNLMSGLLGVVALIRYRAMIPLVFLFYVAQSLAARVVLYAHPLLRTQPSETPVGSIFIFGLLALTVLGFVLALVPGARK